jgi:hypothetical protein
MDVYVTIYIQNPSWEANICLASQEILSMLWNPKDRYGIYRPDSGPYPQTGDSNPQFPILFI